MKGVWDWLLGRMEHATPRRGRSSCRGFVVERLEPRQMLAADCLFLVEIPPPREDCGSFEDCVVDAWQPEGFLWTDAHDHSEVHAGTSVRDGLEEYYLIHLEDVIEEIGQLYEVCERGFDDFDYEGLTWFS